MGGKRSGVAWRLLAGTAGALALVAALLGVLALDAVRAGAASEPLLAGAVAASLGGALAVLALGVAVVRRLRGGGDGVPGARPVVVLAAANDVAEGRRREEALRESEARFRGLIEGASQGILVHRRFVPLFANEAFACIHGFGSVAEVMALPDIKGLIVPEERARAWKSYIGLMAGEKAPGVQRVRGRRRDGGALWLDLIDRVVEWTDGPAVLTTVIDVTERVHAETEAATIAGHLHDAVEAMPSAVLLIDADRNILLHNRRFREFWNFTPEEMAAHTNAADHLRYWASRDLPGVDPDVYVESRWKVLDSGKPYAHQVRTTDGRDMEIRGSPRPAGGWVITVTDITDRMRTLAALRDSEARFRDLIEGSVQGILILRDFRALFVNRAFAAMTGYDEPRALMGVSLLDDLVLAEERAQVLAWNARFLSGASIDEPARRGRLRRRDGSCMWVDIATRAVDWMGERAIQLTCVDISAQVAAEKVLAARTAQLQALVQAMPSGLCMFGGDLRAAVWNDRYARLWRYPDGLLDRRPTLAELVRFVASRGDFGPVDVEEQVRRITAYVERGAAVDMEIELAHGPVLAIRGNGMPDGGYVYTYADVTDRHRAEDALRRSERQLRDILEAAPVGMLIAHVDGRPLFWNSGFSAMLGTPPEAMPALYAPDFFADAGERTALLGVLRRDGRVQQADVEFRRADGSTGWCMTALERVSFEGQPAVASWGLDITERIRAQDQLRKALAQAEEAAHAKSTFLATMSHEIRTPMNGVLGMLEVLERTTLDIEQRRVLGVIRESASALLTIIDDILDFSKIEAGRLHIEAVAVPVRDLTEGVADLLATRARDKRLDLVTDVDLDGEGTRVGDPVRLRQILLNLVGNAVKFTERGFVAVVVRPGAGPDGVRFEVRDSGIGLSDEQKARLFQPFTQADASTTRRFGGSGLGLSICRRLVDMMGGAIGVHDTPGGGSTFWVEVPLPRASSDAATPAAPAVDLAGLRVLVADDTAAVRDAFAAALAGAGAEVAVAAGAADGFDALRAALAVEAPVQVLVLDHDPGALDGLAVADALTRIPGLDATRVVLATGREDCGVAAAGERLGIAEVLYKPVRRDVLRAAVARAAGRAGPESEPAALEADVGAVLPPPAAEARAAGALILVAEDNPTNQVVIRKQLEQLGFAAEIADNGAAAWEALRRDGCGLLLTDCFMPELDGWELARRIRAAEREGTFGAARRLPIVALTANALSGDAERCFAAGMDDFLSKPVGLQSLSRVIARWLPQALPLRRPVGARAPAVPLPKANGTAVLDLGHVAETFGSVEAAHDLLLFFLETTGPLIDRLAAGLADDDAEGGRHAAHAAAGAARTAGAAELAALCSDIERCAAGGDLDAAKRRAADLRAAFARVERAIRHDLVRGRAAELV
ncbi:PAS-domain containing protein [Azospirillum sp. TSO22-1]|uniref:PAS-domain containing protein n=1 Tax=Azospirillum sp. TSO22-1 TaxID=716789 RepID=UPI000D64BC51|nr:PAS-domain containing protein [Azospirillum sp. TSO22-1]